MKILEDDRPWGTSFCRCDGLFESGLKRMTQRMGAKVSRADEICSALRTSTRAGRAYQPFWSAGTRTMRSPPVICGADVRALVPGRTA